MNEIFCGVDASITSTVICIEENGIDRFICYTTTDKHTKWMKMVEPAILFKYRLYTYPKDYSESEKYKLSKYMETSGIITNDIPAGSVVGMESYSQSSDAGHLVDLVTLGTFIRTGILANGCDLSLYAPMTMKKQACIMSYNNYDIKKKVWRNLEGVAGGSFKKHEMIKAMLKFTEGRTSTLPDLIRPVSEEVLALKGIPKPFDDACDAYWAKEIAKAEHVAKTRQSK